MSYVRHEARLDRQDPKSGTSPRVLLEVRAAQGSVSALKALTPPSYPESLGYLLEWSHELVGRSGEGMGGASPLSWPSLDAWADRTGRNPSRDECHALMQLDTAFRHPEESDVVNVEPTKPIVADIPAWPSAKVG